MADHESDADREDGAVPDPRTAQMRIADRIEQFIRGSELAAAGIFALLFAIGVLDFAWEIVQVTARGAITDPRTVIGLIDTGLLLLIIVEVYQTVDAYIRQSETREIVRLIIYTGIIAMVRKAIIFRTGDYATMQSALLAALSYTIILLGLGALLWIERTEAD
ncbi:MAG: phosphate-starvation-inducible PsiE family protein [Halanaeroarchaeum sp.]